MLFLTHYLPDDPENSQMINLASLILGQNGIWGDLLSVSENGIKLFGEVISTYKKVRDDISEASPRVTGEPGETYEVHEKINPDTGCGTVVLFSNLPGSYFYRVKQKVDAKVTVFGNAKVEVCDGQVEITAIYSKPNAVIVFFGI